MQYLQFLNSLVPDKVTLKAETVQNDVRPPPLRSPDSLTGSRVHVIVSPFNARGRLSTLHANPLFEINIRPL
jgi:hypothetical protein